MRIVGLDLSLCHTGIATINNGLGVPALVTIKPNTTDLPRLDQILRSVADYCRDARLVVMEDFSFGSKGKAVFQIAGLGYLVRHWLWRHSIPFALVSPAELKKFATGRGTAEKSIVLREVWRRWKVEAADDNQADAAVLAFIARGLTSQWGWTPITEAQRSVVKEIARRNAILYRVEEGGGSSEEGGH